MNDIPDQMTANKLKNHANSCNNPIKIEFQRKDKTKIGNISETQRIKAGHPQVYHIQPNH